MYDKSNHDGVFIKAVSFATVSNVAVRDKHLSLKAKGLYTFIRSYITLENFTLYKSFIFKMHEEDGIKGINSAWKELKDKGYLKQYRIRIANNVDGKEKAAFKYEYQLLDEPDLDRPSTINIGLDGSVIEKNDNNSEGETSKENTEKNDIKTSEVNSCDKADYPENVKQDMSVQTYNPADTAGQEENYETVKREVSERLDFTDEDEQEDLEAPYAYKTLANHIAVRDLIVEVLTTDKPKIKIGRDLKNSDEVKATLRKFDRECFEYLSLQLFELQPQVTNPREYLLSCIYNTVKTYPLIKQGLIKDKERMRIYES